MGKLADALNFERDFTIARITFSARRLNLAEIFECAIAGVKESQDVEDAKALDIAEELIGGEQVSFPRAGLVKLIVTASNDLDTKDAEAIMALAPNESRAVCRFVLGLNEEEEEAKPAKGKKKAPRWIGWLLTRR